MVKKIICILILFALVIGLVNFSYASFTVGNQSNGIDSAYGPKTNLTGWINISLNSELANSILESSLGGKVKLIDLIKQNPAFIYECIPISCNSNYATKEGGLTQSFTLEENKTALFGMEINANKLVGDIATFRFSISSNNPETEKMPIAIDILDDGQIEWQAYSPSDTFADPDYGCFVGTNAGTSLIATTPKYCERIKLPKTPEVEIGAYVTNNTNATGNVAFEMSIEKSDGSESSKICSSTISGEGIQKVSCVPDKSIQEEGDYFVCIRTKLSTDNGKYKINSEQTSPCGFTGDYEGSYNYDFEIFARPKKYAASISTNINNSELKRANSDVLNVEDYIDYYLTKNYKRNCSKGCIIPIKIYSGIEQQITVSNAFIDYIAETYKTENNIYTIEETPAEISSNFQKLFIDKANFTVPSRYGNYTFSARLNNIALLSKKISVIEMAQIKSLTPTKTAVNYPTNFRVETTGKNITGYTWNFGDGVVQSTVNGSVKHTYNSLGTYHLEVTVNSLRGSSTRNFSIIVGSASEIVPSLIEQAKSNIATIKSQMKNFSKFEQESINGTLKLETVEEKLSKLKDSVLTAVSEEDYGKILSELIGINIPLTVVRTTSTEGLTFFPREENINLNILKKIGGGNYTDSEEQKYKDAILEWESNNLESSLKYSEIDMIYEEGGDSLKVFNVKITKKTTGQAYLIVNNVKDLFLNNKKDYTEKEGYYYLNLEDEKEVQFATTEDIDFTSVPMFISPKLNNLVIATVIIPKKVNWSVPIIIVISIMVSALILWIILQIWYIKKYENYLFKDKNHLYNLVRYIDDSKKKGESDSKISEKLKKAGWSSEQLRYAIRKYERKNTGLPEIIPLSKLFGVFKKSNVQK